VSAEPSHAPSAASRLPPRPKRRAAAVATLVDLQDDYRAWLDARPANLEASRLVEKLQAIVELDFDELQAIDAVQSDRPAQIQLRASSSAN
jgi:hypothetical protein